MYSYNQFDTTLNITDPLHFSINSIMLQLRLRNFLKMYEYPSIEDKENFDNTIQTKSSLIFYFFNLVKTSIFYKKLEKENLKIKTDTEIYLNSNLVCTLNNKKNKSLIDNNFFFNFFLINNSKVKKNIKINTLNKKRISFFNYLIYLSFLGLKQIAQYLKSVNRNFNFKNLKLKYTILLQSNNIIPQCLLTVEQLLILLKIKTT
jgi:hypothetical protein